MDSEDLHEHDIHEHHEQAALHHEHAAKHHREAAKHHKAGDHDMGINCTPRSITRKPRSCTPRNTASKLRAEDGLSGTKPIIHLVPRRDGFRRRSTHPAPAKTLAASGGELPEAAS